MDVVITTGGPIVGSMPPTTDAEIISRISDDIDDTTEEYTFQIVQAIKAAVRYCERNTYYFNETRDIIFPTMAGQEWYDGADNPQIPKLVHVSAAWLEESGRNLPLVQAAPEELELWSDGSAARGRPTRYAYFGQRIRLYPIPTNGTDLIRLEVSPYRIVESGALSGIAYVWLTDAFDMIKARAKYILYKDTLKSPDLASEALNDFNDQHNALKAETTARNGSGFVVATDF